MLPDADRKAVAADDALVDDEELEFGRQPTPPGGAAFYDEIALDWVREGVSPGEGAAGGGVGIAAKSNMALPPGADGDREPLNAGGAAGGGAAGGAAGGGEYKNGGGYYGAVPVPGDIDQLEATRRKGDIVWWSAFCLVMNIAVLVIGATMFHRTWGMYTLSNWLTLLVFAFGCGVFFTGSDRYFTVAVARLYFVFVYVLLVVGTALGIWYLFTLDSRLVQYCARTDITPKCDDISKAHRKELGLLLGLFGLFGWFAVFSIFPRVIFVYLCAVERSFGIVQYHASLIPRWMATANRVLPNWFRIGRAWRDLATSIGNCIRSLGNPCAGACQHNSSIVQCIAHCWTGVTECVAGCVQVWMRGPHLQAYPDWGERVCVMSCAICCGFVMFMCLIVTRADGSSFWCQLADLIGKLLEAMAH